MLRYSYIFLFAFLSETVRTQNLVLNGNFEQYNNLYCNGAGFDLPIWNYLNTPDYYTNYCPLSGGGGVPSNKFGCSYPKNGNSYSGIGTIGYPYQTKEYLYQHLSNPLISGKSYYVSFFVSKSDRTRIATEKMGAYFSTSIPVAPGNTYVTAFPQVENTSGFLTDTATWVEISGYFIAQGGEEYITIGNFNSNANTDTLYTGTNNPFTSDAGTAYYYIDSVSLYDSLTYVTGIQQLKREIQVRIFPNPNNGNFTIEYNLQKNSDAEMPIFDITGKLVATYLIAQSNGKIAIDQQGLNNGIYYYNILVNDRISKTDKIVIIK